MTTKPAPKQQAPYVRRPWERHPVYLVNDQPSMTQQSHYDQTDVNAIVARFERTGAMPPPTKPAMYGDVTDLQGELTELIQRSQEQISAARNFLNQWQPPEDPPASPPPGNGETPAPE